MSLISSRGQLQLILADSEKWKERMPAKVAKVYSARIKNKQEVMAALEAANITVVA